jgi:hypothetical protein
MPRLVRLLVVGFVAALTLVIPATAATAAGPLQITTASLPSVIQGKNYPATQLKSTGGTWPYTWSVVAGELPYGLKMTPGGRISGATGNALYSPHNITVQIKDKKGVTAVRNLQIVVNRFVITNTSLPKARKNVPYYAAMKTNGACLFGGKMGWEATYQTPLPTGMKISYNGVISGAPKVAGVFNVRIRAVCSVFNNGDTVKDFTLTVS